ncbi:hypothetical protein [Desertivirga brevis]|uniref:hypothetical protein n=1 Tax=Desertivirga brevis TaxID=2810310 RepID=UPI001A973274|nr:hypothetical protein [Pedobacter sp. SYSU D00873]
MAILDKKGFFHGKMGNLNFRYYRGRQVVQTKSAKVKQTYASKESSLEFGLCSGSAKVIRNAFSAVISGYEGGMVNRFNSVVRNSVSACRHRERGDRDLHDADLSYLKGFQFNSHSPVDQVLKVRPKAEFLEENKLKISVPGFRGEDIRGGNGQYYILRFLAVSFDFKAECYRYHRIKDIRISSLERYEGEVIELEADFPKGRVLLLSMSIHAYNLTKLGEEMLLNSKEWSPAELIGAWHIPADEEILRLRAEKGDDALITPKDYYCGFEREGILKRFRELKEKRQPVTAKKKSRPERLEVKDIALPEGDIGFKSRK